MIFYLCEPQQVQSLDERYRGWVQQKSTTSGAIDWLGDRWQCRRRIKESHLLPLVLVQLASRAKTVAAPGKLSVSVAVYPESSSSVAPSTCEPRQLQVSKGETSRLARQRTWAISRSSL